MGNVTILGFADYLTAISKNLAHADATEHTHRPALKALLDTIGKGVTATNEPKRIRCGAPDFIITRGKIPLGHVETKDIGVNLDEVERGKGPHGEQFNRYRDGLPNWILTDYLDFRWYVSGERRLIARVASVYAKNKLRPVPGGEKQLAELLNAFLRQTAPTVHTAEDLAHRMAGMARVIRDLIIGTFEHERERGWLHNWLAAFRDILIPDLGEKDFADMFAQTLAYGLFAARVHMPPDKQFSREMAAFNLPKTNPFLRKLFEQIAGVDLPETIDWAVDDVVVLLRHADMPTILKNFGKGKGREDPVVHFYETFLSAYDPTMREVRGVYYTPEPVVRYIVRSIDHLLKARFGRAKGLADEKTLILDPAVGTATFLYSVIQQIHSAFAKQRGAWNSYVEKSLLGRIFGFELLMAPYAVAHLKLGMELQQTGYTFPSGQRLGIYLTNSLEEAAKKSEKLFTAWISDEANAAAAIKKDLPIMVVLGNPPYSGVSVNRGKWITGLIEDYRKMNGQPLGEKKVWLKNDYVKFLRFGQWRIERTGHGILGFITDHSYLDSPTFRGMRQNLLRSFDQIYILNLHGNAKRRERAPDGSKDENVFDITQGVAIALFVRDSTRTPPLVHYTDLWGLRQRKYDWLGEKDVSNTQWSQITPAAPFFQFVPVKHKTESEYLAGWKVTDIFPVGSNGVQTSRDALVVAFDRKSLVDRIEAFLDEHKSDAEVRRAFFGEKEVGDYPPGDTREWKLSEARVKLRGSHRWRASIIRVLYRPFDERALLYLPFMVDWPREKVMEQLNRPNHALCIGRAGLVASGSWDLVFCTTAICDHNLFYRGSSVNFPLYLYSGRGQSRDLFAQEGGRRPNISAQFTRELSARLGMKFIGNGHGDLKKGVGIEDVFHYAYAVFHSPTYRSRYAESLRIDFPRLPLTHDRKLFGLLMERGAELIRLHTMTAPALDNFITQFPEEGENVVEKVGYSRSDRRGWINKTQYFGGIPEDVWEFRIGGYQVCEKWLKDRKSYKLTWDDIQHYQRILVAVKETLRLMEEIDEVIPNWPLQ